MSRVIKNNDGVAVVEGTPAASLVKDVDKFFAIKPRERMAGESISQPRKIDLRSVSTGVIPVQRRLSKEEQAFADRLREERLAGIQRTPEEESMLREEMKQKKSQSERTDEERRANLEAFDRLSEERKREMTINTRRPTPKSPTPPRKPVEDKGRFTGGSKDFNERTGRVEPGFRDSPKRKPNMPSNRSEARDKAESRRIRFFERRRSRKEAKRSQREQEATQGKFITTLRR